MPSRLLALAGLAAMLFAAPLARLAHRPPATAPLVLSRDAARGPAPRDLPGAFEGPALRDGPLAIHMAPFENLERIDVATLDGARREIDVAAYVLTDYPVIEALARAAGRGVAVRILLDRSQWDPRPEVPPLAALRARPGVAVRVKRGRVLMHLKAYQVDGRLLRLGSANFSASGLKQQTNELTLHESRAAATRFRALFNAMFEAGEGI